MRKSWVWYFSQMFKYFILQEFAISKNIQLGDEKGLKFPSVWDWSLQFTPKDRTLFHNPFYIGKSTPCVQNGSVKSFKRTKVNYKKALTVETWCLRTHNQKHLFQNRVLKVQARPTTALLMQVWGVICLLSFMAAPCSSGDLSSPTRDWTCTLGNEWEESKPHNFFLLLYLWWWSVTSDLWCDYCRKITTRLELRWGLAFLVVKYLRCAHCLFRHNAAAHLINYHILET